MSKSIQIDVDLFCDLLDYFYSDELQDMGLLADKIRIKLDSKLDKIIARELFSRYKRMPIGIERELARKAYIEHKGIFEDYRSECECPMSENKR